MVTILYVIAVGSVANVVVNVIVVVVIGRELFHTVETAFRVGSRYEY